MKKDEIKKYLSQFPNIIEMTREASKLKQSGESEIMVNRCVQELRKEALLNSEKLVKLSTTPIEDTEVSEVGFIPFSVEVLKSPVVVFDGKNILI